VFEVVSGYGTVGLSLGIPNVKRSSSFQRMPSNSKLSQQDYSFSGAFRPLSKLIMCIVMLRGRHRGLPVAIDRAILLPSEYKKKTDDGAKEDGEEHEMTTPPAQRT
jgi:Trk-type K+ transport system membrane component